MFTARNSWGKNMVTLKYFFMCYHCFFLQMLRSTSIKPCQRRGLGKDLSSRKLLEGVASRPRRPRSKEDEGVSNKSGFESRRGKSTALHWQSKFYTFNINLTVFPRCHRKIRFNFDDLNNYVRFCVII